MKFFGAVPFKSKKEVTQIIKNLKSEFKCKLKIEVEGNCLTYSGFKAATDI